MKNIIICLFTVFASVKAEAQLIKEKSIDVSIGYGTSYPYDDVDISGSGFFLQGEYMLKLANWIDLRPYSGLILTKSNKEDTQENEPKYKLTANAFLIGVKTRIRAPIPWVAPFIELGLGTSIGSFETYTQYTNIEDSGLIFHFPWTIGLELGPKQNFDIAFTYYEHPEVEQTIGAFAIGFSIPLDDD